MTTQEMIKEFKISIDKVDTQAYRDLQTGQILTFLNQAQDRYIKQKFDEFERTNRITEDLKNLVSKANLVQALAIPETPGQYILPPIVGTVFVVGLQVGLTRTAAPVIASKAYMPAVPISQVAADAIKISPFNSPYIRTPFMSMDQSGLRIYVDDMTTVIDARIDVIRQWNKLSLTINSSLSEHTHGEIVALAVNIALRNIESERIQENTQETQQVLAS